MLNAFITENQIAELDHKLSLQHIAENFMFDKIRELDQKLVDRNLRLEKYKQTLPKNKRDSMHIKAQESDIQKTRMLIKELHDQLALYIESKPKLFKRETKHRDHKYYGPNGGEKARKYQHAQARKKWADHY